jgi:ribosome-associated toxin RatA of RatAB toxin-antitoxin module
MADQTRSEITISATPAEVMATIADLASYPEWVSGIQQVEVLTEYEDGRPAEARFVIDSGAIKDRYALEYTWDGDDSVSWTLTEGDLLTAMDGTYRLADQGGSTTVEYTLAVDLKIPMIGLIKRKAEKVIVDTALKGLKARVEG